MVQRAEAICTGSLAGHNAVRCALEIPTLILPKDTVIGDIISYANYKIRTKEGRKNRYTFAGSEYFEKMKKTGLYTINSVDIKNKISALGLLDIFNKSLI